jgi:predicted kinase
MPLHLVSGASGTGKTAVCHYLTGKVNEAVLLESDILWRSEFNKPETNYRDYFETWLRMCKNISQSGRPVVLFGAGVGVPDNLEPCIERRYFSDLYYLALTCDGEVLADRLHARPAWRQSSDQAFIKSQINFNHWFIENGQRMIPAILLIDTTDLTIEETATQVAKWIAARVI